MKESKEQNIASKKSTAYMADTKKNKAAKMQNETIAKNMAMEQ